MHRHRPTSDGNAVSNIMTRKCIMAKATVFIKKNIYIMETVHCLMTNDNIMAYGNAVQAESQNNPALASPNLQSQNGTAKTIPYPSTNKPEHENFCKWTIIVLLLSICTTRSTRTSASGQ
jgi:hypothetical protein